MSFELHFSKRYCDVQDPRTRQLIGTDHKTRHLFKLTLLHAPSPSSTVATTFVFSSTWHARLGLMFNEKLQQLVSGGFIGNVESLDFSCMPKMVGYVGTTQNKFVLC